MKCDVAQRLQCGLCGRVTFVIHVDLRFAKRTEMETPKHDAISKNSDITWLRKTESYWTDGESDRSHSLDSPIESLNLPLTRSSSMEYTRESHPGYSGENTTRMNYKVEPAEEAESDDDIRSCIQLNRSPALTLLPTCGKSENGKPYLECSAKICEPQKPNPIQEIEASNLDAYAVEEMRLLMGCPYKVKKSVDPESNKDIRLYSTEEREARIADVNKKYKYLDRQQKYLAFGCQFLTKRRHLEWLTSEPKCGSVHNGISLVRRVLHPRSNASEQQTEIIELPEDFDEHLYCRVALPFPFVRLEKSQFLGICPQPNCQKALYKYNIAFHLTLQHKAWLVKYLPLNKAFSFELDLKVTGWNAKCHAVIQLQDLLSQYSKHQVDLSLTIMSRQWQLSEILGASCQSNQRLTFIWAATTIADCFPLKVNLTLWPKASNSPGGSTISYTGSPYDIKKSTRPHDLIKSGRVIMLTANQVDAFTQRGTQNVRIQFVAMMGAEKREIYRESEI
ncbi:uncharacterized protein LOC6524494 isoform X2 [Drosophila yakuba]|nr:uncharacterized protein LOC6524494 isoform X2 [Drosophila yakuba]